MEARYLRITRRVCTAVALVSLFGCTASGGDSDGEPELGKVPKVTSAADIPAFPMDPYMLDREQLAAYEKAQWIVGERCMARFGLTWMAAPKSADQLPDLTPDPKRYLTIINEQDAAKYAYGDPDGKESSAGGGGKGSGEDFNPSDAARAVYEGTSSATDSKGDPVPEGGCGGEVDRVVQKGTVDGIQELTVGNEFQDAYARSRKDSRVTEAFKKWSACMAESGHKYATPEDAANDPEWEGGSATASAVAVATADVRCKQKFNTVGIWYAVLAAYQKRYIDEHAEHFADVRQSTDAILQNSAAIAAAG